MIANDLYDGQTIDARRRVDAWLQPGFPAGDWTGVGIRGELDFDASCSRRTSGRRSSARRARAGARSGPRRRARRWSTSARTSSAGCGFTCSGEAGTTITLRHAEVLEHDELGIRPLRTAKATDRFILSGGEDVFEPTFTFHGFRYAEVDGWPGELTADALEAVRRALRPRADRRVRVLRRRCSTSCTATWSGALRGNFLDVPTDCPQRDERLGWTGDIAVFAPTAAYLFDVDGFLRDWLRDLAAEQRAADGMVPFVVPDVLKYVDAPDRTSRRPRRTAIWSDAAVWVPWALWQAYGDRHVLRDQYDSMAAHVRRVRVAALADRAVGHGFQFGDWLDPTAPPDDPIKAKADNGVVATACLYRTRDLVADDRRAARPRRRRRHFAELAERIRTAFNEHYVDDDGTHPQRRATVYALAIAFGLLDDADEHALAGERLAELVAENGYRIRPGSPARRSSPTR